MLIESSLPGAIDGAGSFFAAARTPMTHLVRNRWKGHVLTLVSLWLVAGSSSAGVVVQSGPLTAGIRWDAAPVTFGGNERSLQGGLRYSLQGGTYQAFRDRFTWSAVPSVGDFQSAIEGAFHAWTTVDPISGIGTALSFVADFATTPVGAGFGRVNYHRAEIDIFGVDAGVAVGTGFTAFVPVAQAVTLTSGVANYANSGAIAGVDITINNNPAHSTRWRPFSVC